MSNKIYPLTPNDSGAVLFVATQSGPIQHADQNQIPVNHGLVVLDSPSAALAMTLAAPLPGPQVAGGNDGQELRILVVASAPLTAPVSHTVTCPANTISGAFSTITFNAEIGDSISLVAYNGIWWKYIGSAGLS